jgi:hypothetical protein
VAVLTSCTAAAVSERPGILMGHQVSSSDVLVANRSCLFVPGALAACTSPQDRGQAMSALTSARRSAIAHIAAQGKATLRR